RIGADGGAVDNRVNRRDTAERLKPVQKADRFIAAARGNFCGDEFALGAIEQKQIRKRTADIDADNYLSLHFALIAAHAGAPEPLACARRVWVAAASSDPSSLRTTLYCWRAVSREM